MEQPMAITRTEDLERSIRETQRTLGSVIGKPQLSTSLLRRPPVRFIRDIFINFRTITRFGEGLFLEKELEECCLDTGSKMVFLTGLVVAVCVASENEQLLRSIRITKIATGEEPLMTNQLLQELYVAALPRNAHRWEQAVQAGISRRTRVLQKFVTLFEERFPHNRMKEVLAQVVSTLKPSSGLKSIINFEPPIVTDLPEETLKDPLLEKKIDERIQTEKKEKDDSEKKDEPDTTTKKDENKKRGVSEIQVVSLFCDLSSSDDEPTIKNKDCPRSTFPPVSDNYTLVPSSELDKSDEIHTHYLPTLPASVESEDDEKDYTPPGSPKNKDEENISITTIQPLIDIPPLEYNIDIIKKTHNIFQEPLQLLNQMDTQLANTTYLLFQLLMNTGADSESIANFIHTHVLPQLETK